MNMKLLMPILLVGIMVSAGLVMLGSDDSDAEVTSGTCGTNLTWTWDSVERSLTISGTGTTMNDFATTSDNPWFNYTINKLVWDCPNLTRIGNNAFAGQTISDGGELPSNLTSIGNNAFMGNPVTYTRLPYKITSIGENAFKNCTSLALDKLPDKLTSIGNSAFENCPQLKIMTVPYGVTSIGANVFKDCTGLRTFIIPSVITSIEDTAFAGTTNLTQVGNLSNVDIMGKFPNVTGALTLTLSGAINDSGYGYIYAYFYEDVGLLYIEGTGTRTKYHLNASNQLWWNYRDTLTTAVFNTPQLNEIRQNLFENDLQLTKCILPDTVTIIGSAVFRYDALLEDCILPYELKSIQNYGFYGCANLSITHISDKISVLGAGAFGGCQKLILDDSTFPKGITVLYASVFSSTGVTFSKIPDWITRVEGGALSHTNVTLSELPKDWVTSIPDSGFSGCPLVTFSEIPPTVTTIGNSAFSDCTNVTFSSLPEGLTSLGQSVFKNCPNVTISELPPNITRLDYYVFENCPQVTISIIPEGVTGIYESAFEGCTGINKITIPSTVTTLYRYAFRNCSNLEEVTYNAVNTSSTYMKQNLFDGCPKLKSIIIGESVAYMPSWMFEGITSKLKIEYNAISCEDFSSSRNTMRAQITDVVFGKNVIRIPAYFISLTYASSLKSIELNDNLESIGMRAFYGCTSLVFDRLPSSLINIEANAFYNCRLITNLSICQDFPSDYDSGLSYVTKLTIRKSNSPINYTEVNAINLPQYLSRNTITEIILEDVDYIAPYTFYNQPNALSRITNAQVFTDSDFKTPMTANELSAGTAGYVRYILTSGNAGTNLTYTIYKDGAIQYSGTGTTMTDWTATTLPYLTYTPTLTKVEFNTPNLENIGNYAVYNAENLTNIIIPNTVETIGKYAFAGCSDLATIGLGNNLNLIDNYAFQGCESLALTELPPSLTLIHKGAFEDCSALALTKLPSGVTKLAMDSFKNCTSLAMTEIPETIHLVASGVFEGCTQMTDMAIYQITQFSGDSGLRLNTVTLKHSEDANDYTLPEYNPWTVSQNTIQTVTLDGITHLQSNTFTGMNNIYEVLAVDVPNQLGWYKAPNAQSSELADLVAGDEAWLMTYSSAEADIGYDSHIINLDNVEGTIMVNGTDIPLEPDMMVYPATYGEGGNKTLASMIGLIPLLVIISLLGGVVMMVKGKRFEL